ncbi:2-polyprenylphenol 6-hydroxylase [Falsirhodobacter algicola]|uniref:2-polyprenylphenol 6-hydroxylase n=1 Tax=Falsirhodobacter algicola TaxID=2692330 RepID=A0A8J8MSK4_9RHOB|nr:2-polyprenylphenol 6-hydroxylase [Falsirhodobacter algicola]QUS35945.1 2-polyprenylphenol 6-hydroxylase [Falsirhodobacter algicola]
MRGPHNILRLIRTLATFQRTGALPVILSQAEAPARLRLAAHILAWPFTWLGLKGDPSLPPVVRAITALGPAYIKFGQILSTRPDIVGGDLAMQLRYLQDRLPPFPTAEARARIEAELGPGSFEAFTEFSEPVAAASIAQVHHARLIDGRDVAVKVLRPDIERAFRVDVDAFYTGARMVEAFLPSSRRLRPTDVVRHFDGVVMGELDLRLEAAAAGEFAVNTAGDEGFRLPAPVWNLSGRTVMVMDWVEGVGLADTAAIDAAGHNRVILASRVLQLFLNHALRDGFFHADMHHGNLKVGPDGAIIAYDFGIMGRLDLYTRRVYAEILYGFIRRDYRRVAEVHFEAGYVPRDRDIDEFARALRVIGEPIFGMDASHISMARLLSYLFEVTERFGMRTRTELILLQRTMVVVEGVARSLDPHINIWQVARPVVEAYIRENVGPRAAMRDLARTARVLARFGPRLPELVEARLIRDDPEPTVIVRAPSRAAWVAVGALAALAGVAIGTLF